MADNTNSVSPLDSAASIVPLPHPDATQVQPISAGKIIQTWQRATT